MSLIKNLSFKSNFFQKNRCLSADSILNNIEEKTLPNILNYFKSIYNFQTHGYFKWLKIETNRQKIVDSQSCFLPATQSWKNILFTLHAKCPLEKQKFIWENIEDELGINKQEGGNHIDTYYHYLICYNFDNSLNIKSKEELLNQPKVTGLLKFHFLLLNFVNSNHYEESAAMLGILEFLYVDISKIISTNIDTKNWNPIEKQVHYKCHEVLDLKHAMDLFNIIDKENQLKPEILNAMILGAEIIWDTFFQMPFE